MPLFSATSTKATPPTAGTAVITSVPGSATSVDILVANPNRLSFTVSNESTNPLYLNFEGTTASPTSYTVLVPPLVTVGGASIPGVYEMPASPIITTHITGIWTGTPQGNARVTEFTA